MQTVNSVIAQKYPHWEMIIVDDCSSDHSKELLSNINTLDTRVSAILNNKNKGGNACRNQGLSLAKSEYILFLDTDAIISDFNIKIIDFFLLLAIIIIYFFNSTVIIFNAHFDNEIPI